MSRMKTRNKTRGKPTREVVELHQRMAELGALESEHDPAQEALRRSEEKYRNILESIQDGYFEVDLAGKAPFIVGGHEILIGASTGIAIYPDDGTDVDSLVSPDKAMYEAKQGKHHSYPHPPQTMTDYASE